MCSICIKITKNNIHMQVFLEHLFANRFIVTVDIYKLLLYNYGIQIEYIYNTQRMQNQFKS